MEEIFQILLLLAYLAIGLMSITVPTYAICVSYLARETSKTIEDIGKRRKDLSEKLEKLRRTLEKEPGVGGIKEEIKKYEDEETKLRFRMDSLSAKGAVGYPFTCFGLALFFSAWGIYDSTLDAFSFIGSVIMIALGLYRLALSLQAVEQAALRPEERLLPEFRVDFPSGTAVERHKVGEEKTINVVVHNYGKEVAEDVDLMFFFPPEFRIKPSRGYRVIKQDPYSRYADFNAACFDVKILHRALSLKFAISLKMPEKPGTFKIPVAIRARKIGYIDYELTIEVAS